MHATSAIIEHIIISPGHNYVGHFGGPPGVHPQQRCASVRLVAGRGIVGDRYAERDAGHRKQITFFDMDVIDAMAAYFRRIVAPEAVRRNVFVRGIDLPSLVGRHFALGALHFEGVDDCKPCVWMNEAIAPGAEAFLKGKGGLRAMIHNSGELRLGRTEFLIEPFAP